MYRPRWFSPGMIFLGFLAKSPHLQLLTEDEYKKLMTEMPVALKALRGNTLDNKDSNALKGKFKSNHNRLRIELLVLFLTKFESYSLLV